MPVRSASKGEIVRTYVKALLALGEEKGMTTLLRNNLTLLRERFHHHPLLMTKLLNPTFRHKDHMKLIHPFLEGLDEITVSFVERLSHYHRLSFLPDMVASFEKSLLEKDGYLQVNVEVVENLTENQENKFKKILKDQLQKKIILNVVENPDLLGGFRVQICSVLVDYTLVGQLATLHKKVRGE